jgi:uncharacterized protein
MAKPSGSKCNLNCRYCYYLEKENLYPETSSWVMSQEVLEKYIRDTIAGNDTPEVGFVWQGGEPTLLGLEFFQSVIALQRRYAGGKRITNSIQTNGTLLDDDWCSFLKEHGFLVGISIDGPADLHDAYRVDKRDRPTFDQVMRGYELLRKHGVDTNVLTVVNRHNGAEPLRVYRFLKGIGAEHIQFIPVVERLATDGLLTLAGPPRPRAVEPHRQVSDWSVLPEQYGEFLVAVYDEWLQQDVGQVFVQLFEICLAVWCGLPPSLCWFTKTCGSALALEHNGDLYSCDHFVYPEYKLGNIMEQDLAKLARSMTQLEFGKSKSLLPKQCQRCSVRFMCNGECPKRRFLLTEDGEPGLNYLCAAYKRFFTHIDPSMREMAELIRRGRHPREIRANPAALLLGNTER